MICHERRCFKKKLKREREHRVKAMKRHTGISHRKEYTFRDWSFELDLNFLSNEGKID